MMAALLPSEAENAESLLLGVSTSFSSSISSSESIASPMLTRPVQNSGPIKRSQIVNQKRPAMPVTREMSNAAKLLLTSARSLSASFQGMPERRKDGPELVTQAKEKVKLSDKQRWPGRLKPVNSSFLTQSLDCGNEKTKFRCISVSRTLSKPVIEDEDHRVKVETKLNLQCNNIVEHNVNSDVESVSSGVHEGGNEAHGRGSPRGIVVPASLCQVTSSRIRRVAEPGSPVSKYGGVLNTMAPLKQRSKRRALIDSPALSPRDMLASKGLVSSLQGGVRPASPDNAVAKSRNTPLRGMQSPRRRGDITGTPSANSLSRGMPSPSRIRNGGTGTPFANSLSRGMPSPPRIRNGGTSSPSTNFLSKGMPSPPRIRNGGIGTLFTDSLSRGMPSPPRIRNGVTATPSTLVVSRGMPSPARIRNGVTSTISNNGYVAPSILSSVVNARRGKIEGNLIIDAHELRLLYNRQIQWRFVNDKAEASLTDQTKTSERKLYSAWLATSKLRHSVMSRRLQLQLLQQNLKLYSILKGQLSPSFIFILFTLAKSSDLFDAQKYCLCNYSSRNHHCLQSR